jgi:hypothetical protein
MVDVSQFIFSHFPDVQTVLYLAGHELIAHVDARVGALLLPFARFSRRVECHCARLADVISISMEVLQQWPLRKDMYGNGTVRPDPRGCVVEAVGGAAGLAVCIFGNVANYSEFSELFRSAVRVTTVQGEMTSFSRW